MESPAIIGFGDWLQTPAGRYLLAWEQQHVDRAVADIFGFHALQLGLPQLAGLQANRMGNRWLATTGAAIGGAGADVVCDFDALPFDGQSLDLVVLPHTLELAGDPHRTLAEVERVLRPEGRAVLLGFNPASLWGLRQRAGSRRNAPGFAAATGDFIGYRRVRDWLRLLGFDLEIGRFGCYRPPLDSDRWLDRFAWTERWGDRWWPVFGAVYALTAVKRVRGMRLVGLARQQRAHAKALPAVVAHLETTPRLRVPPPSDSHRD